MEPDRRVVVGEAAIEVASAAVDSGPVMEGEEIGRVEDYGLVIIGKRMIDVAAQLVCDAATVERLWISWRKADQGTEIGDGAIEIALFLVSAGG